MQNLLIPFSRYSCSKVGHYYQPPNGVQGTKGLIHFWPMFPFYTPELPEKFFWKLPLNLRLLFIIAMLQLKSFFSLLQIKNFQVSFNFLIGNVVGNKPILNTCGQFQVSLKQAAREKCSSKEFFWHVFFRIWTEYGDLQSMIQKYFTQ